MENNFYTHFYNATSILKNDYKKFIGILLFYILVDLVQLYYSVATDDTVKILSTLGLGLISIFISVYLVNKSYALLTETKFSLRKVFWDIPTYLFYELGFGLALLIGALFFVIPGIYFLFCFMHVPIVSICFDHLDEREGVFSLTKKAVFKNKALNFGIYILIALISFLYMGVERLYALSGQSLLICLPLVIVLAHIAILQYAIIISMLNTSIKEVLRGNDETQSLDHL